ncbi:hypothetical protein KAR91_34295 [Candidatus Pacearchaeota archaeon]|nr:hypothetical protein [Candidatus Pacearchaeota archaeon]
MKKETFRARLLRNNEQSYDEKIEKLQTQINELTESENEDAKNLRDMTDQQLVNHAARKGIIIDDVDPLYVDPLPPTTGD